MDERDSEELGSQDPDADALPPPASASTSAAGLRLNRGLRLGLEWLITLVVSATIVLILRAEVASPYRIPSSSMEPTLHCAKPAAGCEAGYSDRVIVNRLAYHYRQPKRGEIIVFQAPPAAKSQCGEGGVYVKRLVGLPGEVVAEYQGQVYINGRHLAEPYIKSRDDQSQTWPRLRADQFFVMGDNRPESCDSRIWGPVGRKALIGPVFLTYWPPRRLSWR